MKQLYIAPYVLNSAHTVEINDAIMFSVNMLYSKCMHDPKVSARVHVTIIISILILHASSLNSLELIIKVSLTMMLYSSHHVELQLICLLLQVEYLLYKVD